MGASVRWRRGRFPLPTRQINRRAPLQPHNRAGREPSCSVVENVFCS